MMKKFKHSTEIKIQNVCPTANKASRFKLPGINLQCTFTQQGQQHSLKTVTILQPIAFTLKTNLTNANATTTAFHTSKSHIQITHK